jgi:peptide/nickel transport system substrate-binding protein
MPTVNSSFQAQSLDRRDADGESLLLLTRRELLHRAGLAVFGVAVVANYAVTAVQAQQAPGRGGTLPLENIADFNSLEGQTIAAAGAYDHLYSVWDRLIAVDHNQQPQPMLAASWEASQDYRDITFHLRQGVQFHMGRELTAADVKWSLERIQDPKIGSVLTGCLTLVTGIETPDDYTVVVHADRPWVEAFDSSNRPHLSLRS